MTHDDSPREEPSSKAGPDAPKAVASSHNLALTARQEKLLQHPGRRKIFEAARRLGRTHFRALARVLEIPPSTLHHHLESMRRAGLVRDGRVGHLRQFYVPTEERASRKKDEREWGPIILELLRTAGPSTSGDVRRTLGISSQLAHYHLERLRETQRAGSDMKRRNRTYFVLDSRATPRDGALHLHPSQASAPNVWAAGGAPEGLSLPKDATLGALDEAQ